MMEQGFFTLLWEARWRVAAWLVPPLLAVAIAHKALLPLAHDLREARARLVTLRENIYEKPWLDSTQAALTREVELLEAFHAARLASLADDAGIQSTVDRIRNLAQASGIEVIKTTPVLAKAEPLRLLKVSVEGFARYPGILDFFGAVRRRNDLYLEEMLLRRGQDGGGRMEARLVLHVYTGKDPATPGSAQAGGEPR